MRVGEYKCRAVKMCLKLKDQQLKPIISIYILLYKNLTLTTKKKPIIDAHTQKEKGIQT